MTTLDLKKLREEVLPLLEVHGVELVALEWFQGADHGLLRVTLDLPGGHPSVRDPEQSVSLAKVTGVTRDLSTALDGLDLIPTGYTLEVGSPGLERPVQKREDFDRFAGLKARLDTTVSTGKRSYNGVLRGTVEHAEGGFAVRIECAGKVHEVPAARLSRARLHEVKEAPKPKPGKGPSRRQARLAERAKARAINEAHLRDKARQAGGAGEAVGDAPGAQSAGRQ